MTNGPFGYIAGGAGREETMRSNREAFLAWQILPRVIEDVSKRDLSVTILGRTYPLPYFFAPISIQGIAHPSWGMLPIGFNYFGQTMKMWRPACFAARKSPVTALSSSPSIYRSMAGGKGDVQNRYVPFAAGQGTANFFTDPVFRKKLKLPPEKERQAAIALFGSMFFHPGLTAVPSVSTIQAVSDTSPFDRPYP